MGMGQQKDRQGDLMVSWSEMPRSPGRAVSNNETCDRSVARSPEELQQMSESVETFVMLRGALSDEDLTTLKHVCQQHLRHEDPIPSYVLIDQLNSPIYKKVKKAIEHQTNDRTYYLNDFYFYSDDTFQANWHMDTEFFTFESCLNAWILLSPNVVDNPLAFIADLNDSPSNYFHSLKINDGEAIFTNYSDRKQKAESMDAIEAEKIDTPTVRAGDILLFNPKKFHKTNVATPKHSLTIKFLLKGEKGFLSEKQVPELFWAETALFNKLVKNANRWDDVLDELRRKLKTPEGRKILSAGFFPEKIRVFKEMVELL